MVNLTSEQRRGAAHDSRALREASGPTSAEILTCFLLAGAVVALDLLISSRFGLFAYPPMQDGLTYMAWAKSLYYAIVHFIHDPRDFGFNWALLHAPLWVTLMSTTFFLFGEGEWQSHVVRIWPLFSLFLLIFWFVRRRWNSGVAWFAVGYDRYAVYRCPRLDSMRVGPWKGGVLRWLFPGRSPSRFPSRRIAGLGSGPGPR